MGVWGGAAATGSNGWSGVNKWEWGEQNVWWRQTDVGVKRWG